jgi:hypothetical protein
MTTIKVPAGKHSDTGASGADRWMNCPGSVRLVKKMGNKARKAGHEAAFGTAAHTVASMCLEDGKEPWEFTDVKLIIEDQYEFVVGEEIVNSVQVYVDFVNDKMKEFKSKSPILHIERALQSKLHKDAWGTADVTIEVPGERLIVPDFKNGMMPVEVTGAQTKFYGCLAMEHMESDEVDVVSSYIIQPRAPHHHGPIRKAHHNPNDLKTWFKDEVIPAIDETKNKDAHLVIGPQCRWCDARDACPAIQSELMHFNTDVDPIYLTDEELSVQMKRYAVIAQYGEKSLKEETFTRIKGGAKVDGYKMVEKQSKRVFKDTLKVGKKNVKFADAVKKEFGDDAFDLKPKSPAQLEKLIGGKAFTATWSFKPKTGYTIDVASSSKPEAKTAMEKYEGEEEEITS